jgi:ubiquinone/menaquinone biosynthesis C-methylase UbiE
LGLLEALGNTQQQVLEVCVGTAASSILVATHHPQNQILGIDISDEMLSAAQRKIAQRRLTNLVVRHMSAEAMQLADGSFEAVMISFALHEFEQGLREKVFKEISGVLKPGGKLCVIDFARQDDRLNRIFIKAWALFEPAGFSAFLGLDWQTHLKPYGLRFESEREYSFSKLYVLRKM